MHGLQPQVISTGRGRRGNIRSPSRDYTGITSASRARSDVRGRSYDRETIARIDEAGRGGAGNMTGSLPGSNPRYRSSESVVHSSGRGGFWNTIPGPDDLYTWGREPEPVNTDFTATE
jgi:hypothetical protein